MEQPPNNPGKKINADFIRHSKANYETYKNMVGGDAPDQPFDHKNQVFLDLSSEGIALAKESAQEFFKKLDPEKDELFFVSSNEARALQTAGIYREEALNKNYRIVRPDNARSPISEKFLDGDVRVIDALSINFKSAMGSSLLNPPSSRHPVNLEGLKPEEADLYQKVQAMIDADNKGSFAANYIAHGNLIKKYYPDFETAEDLYERNFKNLIRLFRFAEKKAEGSESKKQLRIVAFGHENQLLIALNKYFQEQGIHNCEVLSVESGDEGEIKGSFRGKEVKDISE